MAHFPDWEKCSTPANLTSFMTWFHQYTTAEEQKDTLFHFSVEHRQAPTPAGLATRSLQPHTVPFQVTVHGSMVLLPVRQCLEPNFRRCREGRGGWQFKRADWRWTPRACLHLTPDQHKRDIYKPWPQGMLLARSTAAAAAGPSNFSMKTNTKTVEPGQQDGPQAWLACVVPEPAMAPPSVARGDWRRSSARCRWGQLQGQWA